MNYRKLINKLDELEIMDPVKKPKVKLDPEPKRGFQVNLMINFDKNILNDINLSVLLHTYVSQPYEQVLSEVFKLEPHAIIDIMPAIHKNGWTPIKFYDDFENAEGDVMLATYHVESNRDIIYIMKKLRLKEAPYVFEVVEL